MDSVGGAGFIYKLDESDTHYSNYASDLSGLSNSSDLNFS